MTYTWGSVLEEEGEEGSHTPLYYLHWEVSYHTSVLKVVVVVQCKVQLVQEVQVPLEV